MTQHLKSRMFGGREKSRKSDGHERKQLITDFLNDF